MADYLFKDHKPSASQGEARLHGLERIIYSKTISPRLSRAKPACAGYSRQNVIRADPSYPCQSVFYSSLQVKAHLRATRTPTATLSSLAPRLSPLASPLSPLASPLSPLASPLSPLAYRQPYDNATRYPSSLSRASSSVRRAASGSSARARASSSAASARRPRSISVPTRLRRHMASSGCSAMARS